MGPYLKVLAPDAFVATVPPIKQLRSVGSGGYSNPFDFTASCNSESSTPGSTIAKYSFVFISIILLSFSVEITIPPCGTLAPVNPVPFPEIVTDCFFSFASLITSATSKTFSGI